MNVMADGAVEIPLIDDPGTELTFRGHLGQLTRKAQEVADAAVGAKKAQALVEVARRAGEEAGVYMRAAREADRDVGLALVEARTSGEIADQSAGRKSVGATNRLATLADLGIQGNYAAEVALFARIPDDAWQELLLQATSRSGLVNLSRAWVEKAEQAEKEQAEQLRQMDELENHAHDLHTLVADGQMVLPEAWAAYEKRTEAARRAEQERRDSIQATNRIFGQVIPQLYGILGDPAGFVHDYDPADNPNAASAPTLFEPDGLREIAAGLHELAFLMEMGK